MSAVTLSADGPIGRITIDRPAKRNALTTAMLAAWPDLLAAAASDKAISVLIVTGGAGTPFSAGADIEEFAALTQDPAALDRFCTVFAAAQTAMADFPKPSIAMISGACVGGGCGLALGCDLRLADRTARFGITPARLGLDYGVADTKRLVDAVGFAHAADLLFTGRIIDAHEAAAIGLINRVVEPAALEAETLSLARQIAGNAPGSLVSIKAHLRAIRASVTNDDARSRAAFREAFTGPEFAEGLAAFLAKRPARFG